MNIASKRVIIFDLDGTLSESKTPLDDEMAELLSKLLMRQHVAVMSGGRYEQIRAQCVDRLAISSDDLRKFFLFPACGTSLYRHDGEWVPVYKELLSESEKEEIRAAFHRSFSESGFTVPEKLYGELIEDRETQMAFSAFGQEAPLDVKGSWDPDGEKRQRIIAALKKHIPHFELRIGGTTSIDVTRKGIDKAYGVAKMEKHLDFTKPEMLFVGDALFPGGNDYPVQRAGVDCLSVHGPEDTKALIRSWL